MSRQLVLLIALTLSACSLPPARDSRGGGVDYTRTSAVPQSSAPLSAGLGGPDIAVAQLPVGAGSIARVRERHYSNGITQEIVLTGGAHGENRLDIAVQKSSGGREAAVPMGKPTEGGIKGEIAGRFAGVAMRIVNRAMRNSYGDYGLAIGRHADGTRCIYAWQWIDSVRGAGSRGGVVRSLLGGGSPASVRVRLCRGDATIDQLAAYMDQLEIGAPASLDRVWQADWQSTPLDQQDGLLSAAVQDDSLDRALGGGAARSPVINAPRHQPRRGSGKRDVQEPSVRRSNVAPQNEGPYLAPLSPGEAAASRQQGGGSPSLDPSVPSRAYRGPARSAPQNAPARRGTIDQAPAQNPGVKVPAPSEPVKSEPKKQDAQAPGQQAPAQQAPAQQAPAQQAPAGGAKGGPVPPPP